MPSSTVLRSTLVLWLVIAAAAAITGCGLGAGPGTRDVSVLVTSNFGTTRIGALTEARVPGAETVMSLLERHFQVGTRYGGGFVESIDGRAGNARRVDWFYFVNGIEAGQGAAATAVHAGDHVWWDLHSWAATDSIPAVVGSYPEPFTGAIGGKRRRTVRECASGMGAECDLVASSLRRSGVPSTEQPVRAGAGAGTDGLMIGTWSQIRRLPAAQPLAQGPAESGVYAKFVLSPTRDPGPGLSLALENPAGTVAQNLRGSVGLIAATDGGDDGDDGATLWFVTGTDAAGVMAAARAFTATALDGHFAVAVDGARVLALPVDPSTDRSTPAGPS